jgi:hypothetical protein
VLTPLALNIVNSAIHIGTVAAQKLLNNNVLNHNNWMELDVQHILPVLWLMYPVPHT